MGNYQLTVDFNITNTHNTETITYTAFIVVINEGSFNVVNGSAIKQVGVVTHANALSAYNLPEASYAMTENVYGGDFFGSIKKFFSPVADVVKKVAPYAKTAYDIGKFALPLLGLGGRRCPPGQRKVCMKKPKKKGRPRKSSRRSSRRGRGGVILGDGLYGEGFEGGEFIDRNELPYAEEVEEYSE